MAKGTPIQPRDYSWFGYKRDQKDHRDRIFKAAAPPPAMVDLSAHLPRVMDQGALGSCTAHGITAALRFCRIKAGKPDVPLSRLQLYYDERAIEGTIRSDAGAEIRDGIKTAAKLGVGPEGLWAYDIAKFRTKPPAKVYKAAKLFQALTYQRVAVDANALKAALATGFPVIIGITVFKGIDGPEASSTGMVPMPDPNEAPIGGHCMLVWGYGQKPGCFSVRNSWGPTWGNKGDCFIPEAYLGSPYLGSDYWLVNAIG